MTCQAQSGKTAALHNECALMLDDLPISHMASKFRTSHLVVLRTDMCLSSHVEGASVVAYNSGMIYLLVSYNCNQMVTTGEEIKFTHQDCDGLPRT